MNNLRAKKKQRIRVVGSTVRPRLSVFRSLKNLSAQIIDDSTGKTLAAASSLKESGNRSKKAEIVGATIAKKAKAVKITTVVFDRNGFVYQGVVKKVAEAARQSGLEF